jgi:hypothetical protein
MLSLTSLRHTSTLPIRQVRYAQEAGGRGQLGEQVMTVRLLSSPIGTATYP